MNELSPIEAACGGPSLATLRRYDTGELAPADAARVQAHVDGCEACQAVLGDFSAERTAVRLEVPFSAIEARLPGGRALAKLRRFSLYLALPLIGAAAALFLVPRRTTNGEAPAIRRKGARLDYFVKTPAGVRPGNQFAGLRPGDRIRFRYDAERMKYVLIVGVDPDGKVSAYAASGDRSMRSAGPGLNLVPSAVTLDADPQPERVFALFSNEPIAVDEIVPAAKDALHEAHGDVTRVKHLPLARDVEQATVLLRRAP